MGGPVGTTCGAVLFDQHDQDPQRIAGGQVPTVPAGIAAAAPTTKHLLRRWRVHELACLTQCRSQPDAADQGSAKESFGVWHGSVGFGWSVG